MEESDNVPLEWSTAKIGTSVDWFQGRMKASGIKRAIADKCGIHLSKECDYFLIPYFTIDGEKTTHYRQRMAVELGPPPDRVYERGQSAQENRGKYLQPRNSKNYIYWPPLYNQRMPYNNVGVPLLICEGELKSVCAQSHLAAVQPHMLVCGVPGTQLHKDCMKELRNIPCRSSTNVSSLGEQEVRRIVYLAMDWNGRGASKDNSDSLERQLRVLFMEQGAIVVNLRWPIEEKAGEQKLDDWLVAGGDLSAALQDSLKEAKKQDEVLNLMWDHLNTHYAILHGAYVPLRHKDEIYKDRQLDIMESQIRYAIGKRALRAHDVWDLQPVGDRNRIDGLRFVPPPLGQPVDEYIYEQGMKYLNNCPPCWESPPWLPDPMPDATPFVRLVERLCQEHTPWFLDFLAQGAQYPTHRGQHIVLFLDQGGTGKSGLFKTLDKVFGTLSGPVEFHAKFNARIGKLLFAHDSDTVAQGYDRDLETRLKNYSGEGESLLEDKFIKAKSGKIFARILIAANRWITPISAMERRWVVFGAIDGNKLPTSEWATYENWLDNGGVDAIRYHLMTRDLSKFDIRLPGPRTEQRIEVERVSAPVLQQAIEMEDGPFSAKDVWTPAEMLLVFNGLEGVRKMSPPQFSQQIHKVPGLVARKLTKDSGKIQKRVWVLRNAEQYASAEVCWEESAKPISKQG